MYRKMHRHGLVRHGFNGAPGSRELV